MLTFSIFYFQFGLDLMNYELQWQKTYFWGRMVNRNFPSKQSCSIENDHKLQSIRSWSFFLQTFIVRKQGFLVCFFFGGGGWGGSSVKYLDLCFFSSLFTKLIITTEYLLPGRRSLILRARFLCFFQQKVDQWFDFTTIRIEISSFCLNIVN